MSGPPKTPTELKIIAGTDRADRREEEPLVEFEKIGELPRPPQFLNADGAAMWKMLGEMLVNCGVLQAPDMYQFQQLCYAWQRFVAKAKAGEPVTPSEHNTLNVLFGAFGINPSARRRVARYLTEPPKKENRFATHGKRA